MQVTQILPTQNNTSLKIKSLPKNDGVEFSKVGYFALKDMKGIFCSYCGDKAYTLAERKETIRQIQNARGKRLSNILNGIFSRQKPIKEHEVAQTIGTTAEQFPAKNIKEILTSLFPNAESRLVKSQKTIIEQTRQMAASITGITKQRIDKDFRFIDSLLSSTFGNVIFKRKTLLQGFKKLLDIEQNPENRTILGNIFETLPKLPTSGNSVDAFIAKYHRRSSGETAYRLIEPFAASAEHIKPESLGGASMSSNYIIAHKKCNEDRAALNFKEYLETHPEMVDFIYQQLDFVNKKIAGGYKFQNSETYIDEVAGTLYHESEGLVDWYKYINS